LERHQVNKYGTEEEKKAYKDKEIKSQKEDKIQNAKPNQKQILKI